MFDNLYFSCSSLLFNSEGVDNRFYCIACCLNVAINFTDNQFFENLAMYGGIHPRTKIKFKCMCKDIFLKRKNGDLLS